MKLSLPTVQAAAVDNHSLAVPVRDDCGFTGTFTPTRFASEEGCLLAKGVLNGTLDGDTLVVERVALPVTRAEGRSRTLRLTLGPADVAVRGTPLHVDEAVLRLKGRPGLHVNLVCAASQLVENGEWPALVPDLLNQILART